MKTYQISLIDLNPSGMMGRTLAETIEAEMHFDVTLKYLSPKKNSLDISIDKLCEAIKRGRSELIFFVLSQDQLGHNRALFKAMSKQFPDIPTIVVMDVFKPGEMFLLLKSADVDFIAPIFEMRQLIRYISRLLDKKLQNQPLKSKLKEKLGLNQLVGESPAFLEITRKIPMVGMCDAGVLISGETGTGKEMCARAVHYLSSRSRNPFIAFNCGAVPDNLIENELFGHVSGAFTGASKQQAGLIKEADGGTLFLDDVDCLTLSSQVKLLRFLQEKEYRQLGSTRLHHADIRIIAATNTSLGKAVDEGRFRQDLYYRLNIIPMAIPALRNRKEDIPLLAQHFMEKYAISFNKTVQAVTPEAIHKLKLYHWPGNVRELEHVIERAVLFSEKPMIRDVDIVLPQNKVQLYKVPFKEAKAKVIKEFEENYIEELLISHQGNITRAARTAQKNRRAFWQLIRKHQIDVQTFRTG